MGVLRTVSNPLNKTQKIEGAYSRIGQVAFTSGFSPELGKVTDVLTATVETYQSEEAFQAGSQQCAPPENVQLNSDVAMVIEQEQRNSVTQEVLAPAVRGPKLGDFFAAIDKSRQDGDEPQDLIKRGLYAVLDQKAAFKDAKPVLAEGQTLVSVEFAAIAA